MIDELEVRLNAAQAAGLPGIENQRTEAGSQKSEVGDQKPAGRAEILEEVDDEAEVVVKSEVNHAPETIPLTSQSSDEGYVWPDGAEIASGAVLPSPGLAQIENTPLPSLDELVKRIPSETREILDDLFRVKFTSVGRIEPNLLK